MVALPDSARALLASGALAHCTTLNADGSPQVSAVWVDVDGDQVLMAHMGEHRKVRNLRRDPRIVLSLEHPDRNDVGTGDNLVLYGTATVTEGGAPELLATLARRYGRSGAEFPLPADPPPGFVVRIDVDRVTGVGPWTSGH